MTAPEHTDQMRQDGGHTNLTMVALKVIVLVHRHHPEYILAALCRKTNRTTEIRCLRNDSNRKKKKYILVDLGRDDIACIHAFIQFPIHTIT